MKIRKIINEIITKMAFKFLTDNKKKYLTYFNATSAASYMKSRTGIEYHVYRCSFCNAFHIGKTNVNKKDSLGYYLKKIVNI